MERSSQKKNMNSHRGGAELNGGGANERTQIIINGHLFQQYIVAFARQLHIEKATHKLARFSKVLGGGFLFLLIRGSSVGWKKFALKHA